MRFDAWINFTHTGLARSTLGKQQGISFIEVVFALLITGVLSSIALPAMGDYVEKSDSEATTSRIYHAYQLARDYAVANNTNVLICGSNDGSTCSKTWSKTVLVFRDENADRKLSEGDSLVLHQTINTKRGNVTTRAAFGRPYTLLTPRGAARLNGSMIYCPEDGDAINARRITWNRAGRVYHGRDLNGDGFIDDTSGRKKIDCSK